MRRLFVGKFTDRFEEQLDKLFYTGGEKGSTWYNGIDTGDYVFAINNGKVVKLLRVKGYENAAKYINNASENQVVATFEEIKDYGQELSLSETFLKCKYFNLDINLLNKASKSTPGYGFFEVNVTSDCPEFDEIDFNSSKRHIYYISDENKNIDFRKYDIRVNVLNDDNFTIKDIEIYDGLRFIRYDILWKMYKENSSREKWDSLKELLKFHENDNATKKYNYLKNIINKLEQNNVVEDTSNPCNLYDNLIVGRKKGASRNNGVSNLTNEKERNDSWSHIEINNVNFIARKTVDYSSFTKGTTISTRYHEDFLNNLSTNLTKGSQMKIIVIINNIKYDAVIRWVNFKNRTGKVIQLIYKKKLLEFLAKELNISYDYIIKHKDENSKAQVKLPDEYKEYMDFYKGPEKDTFIVKLIKQGQTDDEDSEQEEIENPEDNENEEDITDVEENEDDVEIITEFEVKAVVDYIHSYIKSKGYTYEKSLIRNLYISLKTKPFVILSGISGTGKSKIVELFAEALGATSKNHRFNLIPVKPDWSDSTDLLGFRNIEGKFTPGEITKAAYNAMMKPELPHFICLDEMNLARV